ncbi:hypothetical protein [Mesorhizobium sp. B2-5-11]|uniref:hypothetical protein n=1 Tax=Mesorhizobium sp. B2-5-11 TaxID=2589919 RepID=UPI00112E2AAB|nr:hypothetical protein [Mesorhizobium sp. B2-5-11]TPK14126.1 hypothetical protein FJ490_02045 [Mesorhizobium sp. B2-5-11]
MMRDEPWDAPIPERFKPSTKFYDEGLAKAREVLATVPNYTEKMCDNMAAAEWLEACDAHRKYESERNERNRRCLDMRAAVMAWQTEAEGIKEFMLQQLGVTLDDYPSEPPKKLAGAEWRAATIEKAERDLSYHQKHREDEIARTEDRNRWLAALRASLPEDVAR